MYMDMNRARDMDTHIGADRDMYMDTHMDMDL
jgi:hypothetical protein